MTELTLLVPELSRCLQFVGERTIEGEPRRWLGQARPVVHGHRHLSEGVFRLFGYPSADNYPSGAICCHSLSPDGAGDQAWLLLTPARFEADLTRLVVSELPIETHLPQALIRQLDSLLAEYDLGLAHHGGALLAYGDWLKQVHYSMPAEETLGRNVAEALPRSDEPEIERRFRKLFNDIQMLLHAFFQNPGEPFHSRFNGFWPHSAGCLPSTVPKPEFDRVLSNWPLARAMAECAGIGWQALPDRLDDCGWAAQRNLMVWHSDDKHTPEHRLQLLIRDCLNPLQQHLASGKLTRLNLLAERLGGWVFQPSQRWLFWRRRKSLLAAWKQLQRCAHGH